MGNPTKQFRTAAAAVICLTLTAAAAGGQTQEETELDIDGRNPLYLTGERVCPWDEVITNPDLAAECLRLAEVNEGLAEYAFTRPPPAGADVPEPEGGEASAGEVPRWAMTEALTRVLTAAGVTLPETDREGRIVEPIARRVDYPDIGWLTPERQAPIYQLRNTRPVKIAEGFRDGGFGAHLPVDRWQMALFFVRTLRVIDAADPGNIPALDVEVIWQNLLETPIDRVSMPFTDREVADWKTFGYSHERYRAVSLLYELGITFGDEWGDYRPYDRVTGPQMALFLVRLLAHTKVRAGEGTETPSEESLRPPPPVKIGGDRYGDAAHEFNYLPSNRPISPDTATRPPREIDYYQYSFATHPDHRDLHEEIGIYEGGELMRLSRPFSLQIGDWWWNGPPGFPDRAIQVVVEFRTHLNYAVGKMELTRVYSCSIPEEEAGTRSGRYSYGVRVALKVGPGLFRSTALGLTERDLQQAVVCDLSDYDVPEPAGGYTDHYPCDDGTGSLIRRVVVDEWGLSLPLC